MSSFASCRRVGHGAINYGGVSSLCLRVLKGAGLPRCSNRCALGLLGGSVERLVGVGTGGGRGGGFS